jgi:hypothetical protein
MSNRELIMLNCFTAAVLIFHIECPDMLISNILLESKPVTPSEGNLEWIYAHRTIFKTAAEK